MYIIGRGRNARETYPEPRGSNGFDPTPFLNQTAWSWLLLAVACLACDAAPSPAPAEARAALTQALIPRLSADPPRRARQRAGALATAAPPVDSRSPSELLVAACQGARGWRCSAKKPPAARASATTPVTPPSWTVPAWDIDRANSIGCASDSNTGTSATCVGGCSGSVCPSGQGPLLTCQELEVHRWGTNSPVLSQNTTITGLSSWSASDADRCYPNVRTQNDAQVVYKGTLSTVQTGTLGAVTAKSSTPPGNMLQAVLGAGLAAGEMVTNSTHSSVAWLFSLVSGTTWNISQPCVPQVVPTSGSFYVCSEVNSWTTGDSYTVSTPSAIAFGQIIATIGSSPTTTGYINVYHANIVGNVTAEQLSVNNLNVLESQINRSLQIGNSLYASDIINSDIRGNMTGLLNTVSLTATYINAGQFRKDTVEDTFMQGSFDLFDDFAIDGVVQMVGEGEFGPVFVDGLNGTSTIINLECGNNGVCNCSTTPCLYGPGVFDMAGMSRTGYSGGTASNSFLCGGTAAGANCLRLNGSTNAYGMATSSGNSNLVCGTMALTPANLDATQNATCGNTGFNTNPLGTLAFGAGFGGASLFSNTD